MLRRPPEWSEQAACDGLATPTRDPWHPDEHTLTDAQVAFQYALARRVCAGCPVRLACARYGLSLLPRTGVEGMFGGLTPRELRRVARRMGLPWQPVAQHGSRSRYVAGCHDGEDGGACAPCKQAHREYEAERRSRVKAAAAHLASPVTELPMLRRSTGRGRFKATEGQLLMFPTEREDKSA